ncbi:MAG: M48 family metalloprotease [Deltaproteobacteria bacterium]|nr:M48 family metalloprotease [Deltaproteobacteria bacterium]
MRRQLRWALALAALAGTVGCADVLKAVRTGRPEDLLTEKNVKTVVKTGAELVGDIKDAAKELTPENEYYLGRSVSVSILARADFKHFAFEKGNPRGDAAEYVARVGYLLAAAASELVDGECRPLPIGGWHFVVLDVDAINAYGLPGGYVFVTRGALKAARNEDELAAVMAHEVAHVLRGHGLKSIKKDRFAKVSSKWFKKGVESLGADKVAALTEAMSGSIDDITQAVLVDGYSRDSELEADELGQAIASRAGYDPKAMAAFIETMAKSQATSSGEFGTTHPADAERVGKLQARLAKYKGAKASPPIRTERFLAATKVAR